ncbi:nephrocystin-4 [Lampris incognitus]|uniref:nephrocystin-4 n=1 Tax=Lampris incognitus TaxID=2546036 RepID=UPI0024B4AE36|nr:nephrocystin-4 [Lampris incognitus]
MSSEMDEWKELFESSRVIPPHSQTARLAKEAHHTRSHGFQITVARLVGPHLQQELADGEQGITYQLRVTLYDRSHRHFFGKTWKSSPQRKKGSKILFNEVLYFHTSLRLPSMVAVLELVALSVRPDGSQQALGCGFTILELFAGRTEAQAAGGDRRLNLYHGSPRNLLHPLLESTTECVSFLKAIDGVHLDCIVRSHTALGSMMHLLPENVLVSGDDIIPGLAASPTGDAMLKPQMLRMVPYFLDRLTIALHPSLENFESQLLQLINTDCHNTKQPEPDGTLTMVIIQERRLHVGVHNGWCFLERPLVVVLEPQALGRKAQAASTSKQSTLAKDGSASVALPQVLALRSSLELRLTNHRAVGIVFQLEYVFSAPMRNKTTLSATSTSRMAFMQCIRWGVWCPFQKSGDRKGEEIQFALQGGQMSNPYGVLVYSAGRVTKIQALMPSSAPSITQEKDLIRFRLLSSQDRRAYSPKASLTSKQEVSRLKGPPSSPLQGSPSSPPGSPQGPPLSLSQLAATSRHPAVGNTGAALPRQQQFPSLLYPSLLASAHQLSHVTGPAPSNIAHLEMDLQQDEGLSPSAHEDSDQLQELPFNPVHVPVTTLGRHTPSSRSVSSRSSLAHLHSAGFPDILDCNGQAAEVLDPTEPMHFDPQREEADPLQGNILVFQFLAFSRIPSAGIGPDWPDNINFTFQFYRFPPITSQQLKLLTADKAKQKANDPLPCVLASINKDSSINSGCPGLQVQFRVDEAFLRPSEKRWFLRYLALHTMQVDIWDSSSLLLIGSTAIELKYMLRQGRSAVQALHEVEVLATDYGDRDALLTGGELDQHPDACPVNVHSVLRGRLHIRTGNIGCPADSKSSQAGERPLSRSHIIRPRDTISGFRGGSLSASSVHQLNVRNVAQAQRLVEINRDLATLVRSRRESAPAAGQNSPDEPDENRRRKLGRMAAVHRRESEDDVESQIKGIKIMSRREERAQLARELRQIKAYQDQSKAASITNMLSQAITTQHVVYASLGTAEYMEFVLKNPFNVPQTVTVHSGDPELSIITDTEEWRYFKALTKTLTPLEENIFHLADGAPGPQVYLRPKESIHIPLKYQTFLKEHSVPLQGPNQLPTGRSTPIAKKHPSNIVQAKSIKVTFTAEDGKPLAICHVNVEPTPHVIDQSVRLYHPELCFLKKAIRLPHFQHMTGEPVGDPDARTQISVRCSDPNVICQTKMLAPGEPQDVYLKVPGSPSPHLKMFFVMVFIDKWQAAPAQIWQIYVHFLERVDVSCVTGQRTCQSLVLRGKQAMRKVKCFSSHPQEIQVDPAEVFALPPAAVQELQLRVQPWRAGRRFFYVNAVDVEHQYLVTAWLLCLNVHRPVLSKAFEVCVPVGGGRGSTRRISYTNPYTSGRVFVLHSDHPDLLQFKEDQFQIGGGESYSIGLRFAPSQSPGTVEILVYVNDLDEKTEETFCVKVNYT